MLSSRPWPWGRFPRHRSSYHNNKWQAQERQENKKGARLPPKVLIFIISRYDNMKE